MTTPHVIGRKKKLYPPELVFCLCCLLADFVFYNCKTFYTNYSQNSFQNSECTDSTWANVVLIHRIRFTSCNFSKCDSFQETRRMSLVTTSQESHLNVNCLLEQVNFQVPFDWYCRSKNYGGRIMTTFYNQVWFAPVKYDTELCSNKKHLQKNMMIDSLSWKGKNPLR
jgi:hypothetical protein